MYIYCIKWKTISNSLDPHKLNSFKKNNSKLLQVFSQCGSCLLFLETGVQLPSGNNTSPSASRWLSPSASRSELGLLSPLLWIRLSSRASSPSFSLSVAGSTFKLGTEGCKCSSLRWHEGASLSNFSLSWPPLGGLLCSFTSSTFSEVKACKQPFAAWAVFSPFTSTSNTQVVFSSPMSASTWFSLLREEKALLDLFGSVSRIAVSFSVSSCCPSAGCFFPLLCFPLRGVVFERMTTSSLDVEKSNRLMSKWFLPLSRRKVRRDALDRNLCPSGLKQQVN